VSSPSGVKVSLEQTGRLRSETDEQLPDLARSVLKVRPSIEGCILCVEGHQNSRDL